MKARHFFTVCSVILLCGGVLNADAPNFFFDGTLESGGVPIAMTTPVATAVDWNNDGMKDLVIGDFYYGNIYLHLNEGTNLNPVFNDIVTGIEKKTNDKSDLSTLGAFVDGLNLPTSATRRAYVIDNIDLSQMLNYLAVRSIIQDADDLRKNFYLLPILNHYQADDDFATKLLNVAVVNANIQEQGARATTGEEADPLAGFKVAITFVIDTTLSMGPYIEQTRDAIRRICDKTQTTQWRERFNFAVIAFRDSLKARPELAYTWRRVAGFKDGRDCDALLREAASVGEAAISSKGFTEDAYAGVNAALTELDWKPYGGRYIVLITDASARSGSNRYSSTRLNAEELSSKAHAQGVAVLALHLLTPEGRQDHDRAAGQYRALSTWPNLEPFYYPLPAGADQFGVEVEQLADALIGQLGKDVAEYLEEGSRRGQQASAQRSRHIDQLGHAMRLAYLGRTRDTAAPEVFEAWVAERNVQDRRKLALEIRVLLTKDQLSDLQTALRQVVEAGDLTDLAPEDFFTQVRKLLIVAQRDSSDLARAKTLGDSVVLGEYLDGLPYRSALTGINQESWLAMGAGERQEIIDDIEAKIQLYQDIHDDPDLWVTLDDGHSKGDAFYPLLLSDLP